MITCPHCQAENLDGSGFCRKCGGELNAPAQPGCVACGFPLKLDAKFCSRCGAPQVTADSEATVIIPRKGKAAPRPSQADIETIMVIEDRPAARRRSSRDTQQTLIVPKTATSASSSSPTQPERSEKTAPTKPGKPASNIPPSTPAAQRSAATVIGTGIAIVGVVTVGAYVLLNGNSSPNSMPRAKASVPAPTSAQASTPPVAVVPLPAVSESAPSSSNADPSPSAAPALAQPVQQAIVPAASIPAAQETTRSAARTQRAPKAEPLRPLASPQPKAARDATSEQRRARKQAEDSLKELLKQQ